MKHSTPWMISDVCDSFPARCSGAEVADIDVRLENFGLNQETSGDRKRIPGIMLSDSRRFEQQNRTEGKQTDAKWSESDNQKREKWPYIAGK
jgi:hypothetical protein